MNTFLYNPDRKTKGELIAEFVVRTEVYDDIMQDLETSTMQHPEQHYLLVGQRGAGKTTLLNRIKYGIEDSAKLKNWVIPVLFSEEQYNVSELANLWENVCQYLEDYQGFDNLYADIEMHISKKNFEEICLDILEKRLAEKNKKLVLLIDNIGDLLRKLDDIEIRRLREILQTKEFIRVIAGSPFYLESILDYQQPLFEFFKVMRLDGLNKQETENLLLKLGEIHSEKEKIERIIKETPQRIEAMRTLTGGVPRTMALLFRIFIDNEHSNSIKDLEKILDAVTPLYKHRMDDLPKQQQKIVDAVARKWDAISVKELKEKVRLESKIISAQLRQLEKNQIIEKKTTDTKNHLYLLKERFWNIWFLMRYGRKDDKERVIWLVRFLESWCDNDEITKRIAAFVTQVEKGQMSLEETNLFSNVYTSLSNLKFSQKMILRESNVEYLTNKVKLSDEELFEAAEKMFRKSDFKSGIKYLYEVNNLTVESKLKVVSLFVEAIPQMHNNVFLFINDVDPAFKTLNAFHQINLLLLLTEGFVSFKTILEHGNIEDSLKLLGSQIQLSIFTVEKSMNITGTNFEVEINMLSFYLKNILMKNLVESAKRVVNSFYAEVDGKTIHFKDVFKPLFYAVEYFDAPEKIQNLPSEIAGVTFEIRNSFLK
ncbi:MAG: AAA family ATPase [Flavobacterium sp.]|nr:AAA family ATPase [Flavobacterium sp.]